VAKVLIIDDDAAVRETLTAIIEGAGHQVATARNGRDILQRLRESGAELVITDILMPEKEGIETIRTIRQHSRTLPIIAVSGGGRGGNMDFLSVAKTFGANLTLAKPMEPEELVRAVAELIGAAQKG
jgi:CheY-like chemotaxis protein